MQLIKVHCISIAKNVIRYEPRKEQLSARRENVFLVKKRKYHDDPEKKRQAVKKRYHDKKESIRQYSQEKYLKNRTSKIIY